ncbi:MAG TPA: efflux RND transporter periplasmic adaptor subunit [Polyangia bacterium]|nr:efflux RND transporter periplasmic adaptor subunit [Polyangia bacterium]
MSRNSNIFAPVLLALGLGLAAGDTGCAEGKAKSAASPPLARVLVTPVARRDVVLYLEAVANLDGYVNAEIRARVRGVLTAQRYKDGAAVKRGQLLFSIDRAEYRAALDSARAAVARAHTALAHNQAQLARRKDLGAARVVSQQELEDAEAAARDAEDQVRAAQAQLRQAELNVSYTEVRSPVAGVAGLANVRVGNLVGQDGPTLLTTVSDVNPIRVTFPMSEIDYVRSADRFQRLDVRDRAWAEAEFARMEAATKASEKPAADDSIELLLSDGTVYPHRGVIVAVNRQVDATTGTIQLQALFPNPGNFLRPGQFGRVRIRRRDVGASALVVPERALIQVQGTYSLAVVGAGDKVQLRRVEVGPSAGGSRIVSSGVAVGERVVVDGVQKVSDGATVIAALAPPAPDAAPARN